MGSWTQATLAPTDLSYFWAELQGQVSAIAGVSTTDAGFVWDTVSHADPGNVLPSNTLYGVSPTGGSCDYLAAHATPFTFPYGGDETGAFLLPSTKYYYRFAVYYGAPNNVWYYSNEMSLTTLLNPEGTRGFQGYTPKGYVKVLTASHSLVNINSGTVKLTGSGINIGASSVGIHAGGNSLVFVFDTVHHPNPGWPSAWTDIAPAASGYAHAYVSSDPTVGNFTYNVVGLSKGKMYYARAAVNWSLGGDWVYGPEHHFMIGVAGNLIKRRTTVDLQGFQHLETMR